MKKILTASLVAMMAVTAARADIASVKYVQDMTTATADTASSALASAKTELEGKITAEAGAREAADTAIEGIIGDVETGKTVVQMISEAVTGGSSGALADAKDYADQQVTALANGQVATNTAAISDMDTAYKAADQTLDGKITAMDGAYQAADTALDGKIAAEKSRAEGAEADLQSAIDALEALNGDTGATTVAIKAAQDAADAAQAAADAAQGEVDTLEGTVADMDADYKAADTALDGKITAEKSRAEGAEAGLQSAIDAVEETANNAQVKSEKLSLGAAGGAWTDLTSATVGYATDGLYTLSLDKGSIKWVKVNEGSAN